MAVITGLMDRKRVALATVVVCTAHIHEKKCAVSANPPRTRIARSIRVRRARAASPLPASGTKRRVAMNSRQNDMATGLASPIRMILAD